MTAGSLPATLDALRFARQGRLVSGQVALADLDRLGGLLVERSGHAGVELEFSRDRGGRVIVSGAVTATVTLVCQRCLEHMSLDLAPQVRAAVIATEGEAGALPDDLDPLVCPEGEVRLFELVQDELILALPVIARHENDPHCLPLTPDQPGGDGARRDNPFAVLSSLKSGDGENDSQ